MKGHVFPSPNPTANLVSVLEGTKCNLFTYKDTSSVFFYCVEPSILFPLPRHLLFSKEFIEGEDVR
ncbi:hypothetical protein AC625_01205 [Peribacillus loiseleuriae]|uniref:Uncharacterized protein n=1 Tax=Peribacillus loiseleuriae TaxID=1679170 RepID=A0A0K9GNU1_9BACI|nr:hypothetical protein AC625_01205 [Peribacillus loiseleuriae]